MNEFKAPTSLRMGIITNTRLDHAIYLHLIGGSNVLVTPETPKAGRDYQKLLNLRKSTFLCQSLVILCFFCFLSAKDNRRYSPG